MGPRPAQPRASWLFSRGQTLQGDSVTAVAAFLLDAARGDVSARTVLQVLQHWVSEGLSAQQIRAGVAVADESCPLRHRPSLNSYRDAILNQFG